MGSNRGVFSKKYGKTPFSLKFMIIYLTSNIVIKNMETKNLQKNPLNWYLSGSSIGSIKYFKKLKNGLG